MIRKIFRLGKNGSDIPVKNSPNEPEHVKFYNQLKQSDPTAIDDIEALFTTDKVEVRKEIFSNQCASDTRIRLGSAWEKKIATVFPTVATSDWHKLLHSIIGIALFDYLSRDQHHGFDAYKVYTDDSGYMIYHG